MYMCDIYVYVRGMHVVCVLYVCSVSMCSMYMCIVYCDMWYMYACGYA